jgi:hypothetical protein
MCSLYLGIIFSVNLDERLDEDRPVLDYRLSEVSLVPVNWSSSVVVSQSDISSMMMIGAGTAKTGTMSTYKKSKSVSS